jgi:Ala-tRNA(Pro) deacylase
MAIAITLQQYLADHDIEYDTLRHARTPCASRTAQASHVSGECLAKAVILRKGDGYVLAILPATHHLRLGALRRMLKEAIGLATEDEIAGLFPDCDVGAVPALGQPYGLTTLVDESLQRQPEIYMEAGDHRTLVHLSGEQFEVLTGDAPHGRFSSHD